jgi:peptidoglycan/LPS O-acetylase OafA/YrhL
MGFNSFRNGWIGVDIFFVISGFLMWHLYVDQIMNREITSFYTKRLKRLLPALSVSILLSALAFIPRLPSSQRVSLIDELLVANLGLSNLYYWLIDQHSSNSELRPLITLWSISLELQFYLLFPILVLFVNKSTRKLFLLFCFSSLVFLLLGYYSYESKLHTLPGKLSEFLLGMIVALSLQRWKHSKKRLQAANFSFLAFILVSLFVVLNDRNNLIWQMFAACFSASYILFGFQDNSRSLLVRILAKIGDYSYSIYLIHFPLFVFIAYSEGLGNPSRLETNSVTIIYLIILGIGSWAMKKFVEDNRWLRDNYAHLFLITLTLALVLFLLKDLIVDFG